MFLVITEALESTGEVQIIKDLGSSIENKDVLIIEDILETGTT